VYVSIRDILKFHLANGHPIDPLVNLPYLGKNSRPALHGSSPRGIELLKLTLSGVPTALPSNQFPTEVTIWSDGFDPYTKKNNRGSAHVLFVSIGSCQHDYHSGRNTYPASLGPSDGDLSIILGKVSTELVELFDNSLCNNVFFDSVSKRELSVNLRVFTILQDRPERCSWLYLTHGNGKYAARFGWSGDLSQEISLNHLSSCVECNLKRLRGTTNLPACTNCFDWNFDNLFYRCPPDFPKDFHHADSPTDPRLSSNGTTLLPFHRIRVLDLITSCQSTFSMIKGKKWTKKEGICFLETLGVSPELANKICSTAERSWKEVLPNLEIPELPASWKIPGVDVCHHVDVPMHLCFLGITKSLSTELVSGWLKGERLSTSFQEKSKPMLAKIGELSLSWCQVEARFGGFVSENWLAYCRILKHTHQILRIVERNDKEYEDPVDLPLSRYSLKQKREWLIARKIDGIDKKSNRATVEPKFQEYLDLPEGTVLPCIVEELVSKASLEEVNDMIIRWHVCMSHVMSVTENPTEDVLAEIDRHIKLFLTSVNIFDSSRRRSEQNRVNAEFKAAQKRKEETQRKKRQGQPPSRRKKRKTSHNPKPRVVLPVWKRKANFLGLLNYPDAMREMGPIRVLTELDLKGEAAIKHIKKHMKQGLCKSWAYNAMLGYYKDRSFKNVLRDALSGLRGPVNGDDPMVKVAEGIVTATGNGDEETGVRPEEVGSEDEYAEVEATAQSNKRFKRFQRFPNSERAVDSLSGQDPVSGFVVGGRYYLRIGEENQAIQIEVCDCLGDRICGADYFSWNPSERGCAESSLKMDDSLASEYFLLLPLMVSREDYNLSYFYMITSEWKELVHSGTNSPALLSLARVPGGVYR